MIKVRLIARDQFISRNALSRGDPMNGNTLVNYTLLMAKDKKELKRCSKDLTGFLFRSATGQLLDALCHCGCHYQH